MNSVSFISGNRSVGLNQFHFEWCPKYRKPFMKRELICFIESSLIRTAQIHKIIIHSLHVGADHIHMFVSLPFDMSVSEAFRLFKGRSSHELRETFPYLKEMFRKGRLWSPAKFCRSISNVKAQTIRNYIENHQFRELKQSIEDARTEADQLRISSFF
jgi:putative transposase